MTPKMNYKVDGYTITEEVRVITPQEASEILATKNTKNRRPNKNHVNALALNMTNGTWVYNGDPIRFDANDVFIDGQHRMLALVKANVALPFKIVRGLNPDCFNTIDVESRPRTLADLFKIDGIPNYVSAAAVVKRYFALAKGATIIASHNAGSSSISRDIKSSITVDDQCNFYYANQRVVDEAVKYSMYLRNQNQLLTIADIGGFFVHLYLTKHHSEDEIKGFFDQLVFTSEITAINNLRNKLIIDKGAIKKMSGAFKQNLIAKVWNYYIKGKDVKVLAYNPTTEGTIEFI